MFKIILIILFSVMIKCSYGQNSNTLIDPRDGNIYKTCVIGTQTWMCENLRYKVEGAIPYKNIDDYVQKYGYLYDWQLANKVCPQDWHLPVEDDWNRLTTYLGGKNTAGGKMKLKEKTIWKDPNRLASNSSNFSAYPSGVFIEGEFQFLNEAAYFWSSEAECTSAYTMFLSFMAGYADKKTLVKTDKASVRCIKD
jgi:uncharacterized protein (TIGR02145 family)